MNLLKNSTLRQRLAFGTGVLAVGGLLYGVFQRHRKEKEEAQLLLKQTEYMDNLQAEINILQDEKEHLMRDRKYLQTRNAMLETKLSTMVALEAEKDAKKVSVRDQVLEIETKSLINTPKENSSKATWKCPPKVNQHPEDMTDLHTETNILLDEQEHVMRDMKYLQTTNTMLETKLSSKVEAEKDTKEVSVRDQVLEVETKSLINTPKENSSKATWKCPPKVNQGCGMDTKTAFLEELKSRVAKRLTKEEEAVAACEEKCAH